MNTANGATIKNDTYLQHVSLKNYKSIIDLEIDFKPGLNIIIGKNASGKTNFINGLDAILEFKDEPFSDSENKLIACFGNDKIEIQTINRSEAKLASLSNEYSNFQLNHDVLLKINDKPIKVDDYGNLKHYLLEEEGIYFTKVLIKYGIYYKDNAKFINVPLSFVFINNGRVSSHLLMSTIDNNRTEFLQSFFYHLYLHAKKIYQTKGINDLSVEDLKNEIILFTEHNFKPINNLISKFSPISRIRLNPDFNIIKEEGSKQTITNFYLEFLIDHNWLTFDLLSDGTKRLFFILSEILCNVAGNHKSKSLNIILLEEPELGIHPHQLHQLMQFIKEQSREKQIILTTHSPQVLDILASDELDRVIICHHDPKNGTQLSHLSEKEIKKAKKYMKEEAFLSDYWRFSDLEPA